MKFNYIPPHIIADVHQFIMTSQAQMIQDPEQRPDKRVLQLAYNLINEEVNKELLPRLQKMIDGAYSLELMAKLLDDYVDTVYVAAWGCIVLNLPFIPAWHEVQRANMAKFPPCDNCGGAGCDARKIGICLVDEKEVSFEEKCSFGRLVKTNTVTGKVIKPASWEEGHVWDVLFEAWTMIKLRQDPNIIGTKVYKDEFHANPTNKGSNKI